MDDSHEVSNWDLEVVLAADIIPPGTLGVYRPVSRVNLAAAHTWLPYSTFLSFLRRMMFEGYMSAASTRHELDEFVELQPPFAVDSRFPEHEVYVCIDRVPLTLSLQKIIQSFHLCLEAKTDHMTANSDYYYAAAREAMDFLSGDPTTSASPPVVFTRYDFESVFGLRWFQCL